MNEQRRTGFTDEKNTHTRLGVEGKIPSGPRAGQTHMRGERETEAARSHRGRGQDGEPPLLASAHLPSSPRRPGVGPALPVLRRGAAGGRARLRTALDPSWRALPSSVAAPALHQPSDLAACALNRSAAGCCGVWCLLPLRPCWLICLGIERPKRGMWACFIGGLCGPGTRSKGRWEMPPASISSIQTDRTGAVRESVNAHTVPETLHRRPE